MRRGFTTRRCPKCNGNVFIDHDNYVDHEAGYDGWYEWCLQCGYTCYLKATIVLGEQFEAIPPIGEPVSV